MHFKAKQWLIIAAISCAITPSITHAAPKDEGRWSQVVDWPLIAIHAVLTPQGKVMSFGTDKNGLQGAQFFYDVWEPKTGFAANAHRTLPNTLGVDSFCSAAVIIPDTGNILMAGGDTRPFSTPNFGVNDAPIFNSKSNQLNRASPMNFARWYPTTTVLASGEILVVGGKDGSGRPVTTPEIYSPQSKKWRSLFNLSTAGYPELYPRQWLAPDGRVFGIFSDKTMYYLDLSGDGSTQFLDKLPVSGNVFQSTSVMYDKGKILHIGGTGSSTNDTAIINITRDKPWIRAVSKPQQAGRSWVDSVVLPNGKIMIVGGSRVENTLNGASYRPEIWDPATERWSLMAPAATARLYHSTALLLKDGRVLVAGGGAPGPLTNTNAEIFSPPYLFDNAGLATRPRITNASTQAPYGDKVAVQFQSNAKISRVTLIKTGAVTHSFNMEQRFLELTFADTEAGITVNMPRSANEATPGYYLLHLINDRGVPSEGHIIKIDHDAQQFTAPYPKAKNDRISLPTSSRSTIDVLANDTGAGLTLEAPNAWSLKGGTVSLASNKINYQSKPGFIGDDNIWYVAKDSRNRKAFARVDITVTGTGTDSPAPKAHEDSVIIPVNAWATVDVLANDKGIGLTVEPPNAWSLKGGAVSLTNNRLLYKPKSGYIGDDTIWYVVRDNQGRKTFSQVNITLYGRGPQQHPIAVPDWSKVPVNTPKTLDVLSNDIGTKLTFREVNSHSVKGATISITGDQLRYTPRANFSGDDSFWYSIKDSQGRTNSTQVKLYVGH